MKTFYGGIKFSEAGNNIAKPMVLRQIQDGTYNVVAPSKWASHEVNHPAWPASKAGCEVNRVNAKPFPPALGGDGGRADTDPHKIALPGDHRACSIT